MTKKKNDKKIFFLEPAFQEVLVCHDPKNRPYVEIFTAKPENVSQENLGIISGIFEVTNISEDSSYIVNYLISVIKKEYFSRPKRGAVESFEAALHKANLALSKLASHGSVGWIGNLNAVCVVIEKNNLHISNTGTASALLLRSGLLTNISEGGEELSEPNPLKTFQDVLSGRMENNDKLILTTDSIFEIFSPEEIKRSALKFSRSDFIQFLNTALVNEMEKALVLVIDITEKEKEETSSLSKNSDFNPFSQDSFQKTPPKKVFQQTQEEKKETIEELKVEYQKTRDGFVDEKTGHIYIKDSGLQYDSHTSKMEYALSAKDKISGASRNLLPAFQESIGSVFAKFKPRKRPAPKIAPDVADNESFHPSPSQSRIVIKEETEKTPFSLKEKFGPIIEKVICSLKAGFASVKNILSKFLVSVFEKSKNLAATSYAKYKNRQARLPKSSPVPVSPTYAYLEKPSVFKNFSLSFLLPDFSKIKKIFQNSSPKQKLLAGLAVFALLIIPYLIVRYEKKSEEIAPVPEATPAPIPLENDTNVIRVENMSSVYQGENVLSAININSKNFAAGKNEIVSLENNKSYPLSSDFENADLVSQMDDLNFIFIIKNKQIVSFSATAGKFQNNNISIPENATLISARSFLTYLYILDAKNNQIYRYPRAEGGFGEKTDWIKGEVDFSAAKDMAINENVYIISETDILKFSRGKKQDYAIEKTATPIVPDKLYTKPDWENLYVLDKTNSRIVKLDKDGKLVSQFYNSEIASAESFSVDEEANLIYISKSVGIESFGM